MLAGAEGWGIVGIVLDAEGRPGPVPRLAPRATLRGISSWRRSRATLAVALCTIIPIITCAAEVTAEDCVPVADLTFDFDPETADWEVTGQFCNAQCPGNGTFCGNTFLRMDPATSYWLGDPTWSNCYGYLNPPCFLQSCIGGYCTNCGTLGNCPVYSSEGKDWIPYPDGTYEVWADLSVGGWCGTGYCPTTWGQVPLGSVTLNRTPTATLTAACEGSTNTLRGVYHFPQSQAGSRSFPLFGVVGDDDIGFNWTFCWNSPEGTYIYCDATNPVPPGSTAIRTHAIACGGVGEAWDEVPWPPCDPRPEEDPAGRPIPACQPAAPSNATNADACTDCVGGPVRLANGNMRYQEHDTLPTWMQSLTVRTWDSVNAGSGLFGNGWSSLFDAHLAELAANTVQVILEESSAAYFRCSGGTCVQTWPEYGPRGALELAGGAYTYTLPDRTGQRVFDQATGRLISARDVVGARKVDLQYTERPTSVVVADSAGAWSWTATIVKGRVATIAVQGGVSWGYEYDLQGNLSKVRVDGNVWREYVYSPGDNRLVQVLDGSGHSIEEHEYDSQGRATTSKTADEDIELVEYDGVPDRGLGSGEYGRRVTWASGVDSTYYLRPTGGYGPHVVVDIRGNCSCPGGGDFKSVAYDWLWRLFREQDARGYITEWQYGADNNVVHVRRGILPPGCVDPDLDPDHCRVAHTDELVALDLSQQPAMSETSYAYDDTIWPSSPTRVCRESVVEPDLDGYEDERADSCTFIEYDPVTGGVLKSTVEGYANGVEPEPQQRTTTYMRYGADEPAAFDPSDEAALLGIDIVFDSGWAQLPQPESLLRKVDGPLPPAEAIDVTEMVYYPVSTEVPAILRGRLAARRNPVGDVTFYDQYDALGNVTRLVDPAGMATQLVHDGLGRVEQSTLEAHPDPNCDTDLDPLCTVALVTSYTYDGAGPLALVTSPGGSVTSYSYDSWARLVTLARGPSGTDLRERATYTYGDESAWGRRVEESLQKATSPGTWVTAKTTQYVYDSLGRLKSTIYPAPLNETTAELYTYDPAGHLSALWKPEYLGSHDFEHPDVKYSYDGLGRPTLVEELEKSPDEYTEAAYAYDTHGNLRSVIDPNGVQTRYDVNDFGETYRTISPATGETDLEHNAAGWLVHWEDARGAVETRDYDDAGNVLERSFDLEGEVEVASFTYLHDRRVSASQGSVSQAWWYDRRGLPVRQTVTVGATSDTVKLRYDANGGHTARERAGTCEVVSYTLDWAGRPTAVTATPRMVCSQTLVLATDVEYLPFGPPTLIARPGFTEHAEYDQQYRMRQQDAQTTGGAYRMNRQYTSYRPGGELAGVADLLDSARDRSYLYDDLGRLTHAESGLWSLDWTYDHVGNRKEELAVAGGIETHSSYFYEEATSLLDSISVLVSGQPPHVLDVTSDDAGNVVSDGLTEYEYLPRGTLASALVEDEGFHYTYDADGRRIRTERTVGGFESVIHYQLPDGTPYFEDSSASASNDRTLVFLGGRLLAIFKPAGTVTHIVSDHIGFPLLALSASGGVAWKADAYPFGEIAELVQGYPECDPLLRYPGQWEPKGMAGSGVSALFYNTHRWYNPGWGRYTQADPMPNDAESTFSYARANPLRYTDPLGLVPTPPGECPRPKVPEGCDCGPWKLIRTFKDVLESSNIWQPAGSHHVPWTQRCECTWILWGVRELSYMRWIWETQTTCFPCYMGPKVREWTTGFEETTSPVLPRTKRTNYGWYLGGECQCEPPP